MGWWREYPQLTFKIWCNGGGALSSAVKLGTGADGPPGAVARSGLICASCPVREEHLPNLIEEVKPISVDAVTRHGIK